MSQPPAYPQMPPEPQAVPPKKSNTVLWVVLILGVGGLCFVVIVMAAILFPVFSQARLSAQRTSCLSSTKQWAFANIMYAADFDDRFPMAKGWMDQFEVHTPGSPLVVKEFGGQAQGYGFNDSMASLPMAKVKEPERTILIFESADTARNAHGGEKDRAIPGRHGTGTRAGNNYGYVNGSARFILDSARSDSWKP